MFWPRLTPERTRSGSSGMILRTAITTQSVGVPEHREAAVADLAHAQGVGERQRMRGARLLRFRRDDPDVVGNLARDALERVEAFGVDAVVIGQKNAHQEAFDLR